jgi:hypothetical protein
MRRHGGLHLELTGAAYKGLGFRADFLTVQSESTANSGQNTSDKL